MNGNEKLLAARAKIEDVLKEYDIAAHVLLHAPGFVEVFSRYDPSYSRLTVTEVGGDLMVRLRSKLVDYGGDKAAQKRDLEATAGMLASFAEVMRNETGAMVSLSEYVNRVLGAEHSELRKVDSERGPTQ